MLIFKLLQKKIISNYGIWQLWKTVYLNHGTVQSISWFMTMSWKFAWKLHIKDDKVFNWLNIIFHPCLMFSFSSLKINAYLHATLARRWEWLETLQSVGLHLQNILLQWESQKHGQAEMSQEWVIFQSEVTSVALQKHVRGGLKGGDWGRGGAPPLLKVFQSFDL